MGTQADDQGEVANDRSRVWQRADGAWCLGSKCFKAIGDPRTGRVSVKFRSGNGCPPEMGRLIDGFRSALARAAETGAEAEFGTFEAPED